MPVYDFTWKGQSAYEDYDVDTLSLGPAVIAERRDNPIAVPGRDGLVHDQDGAIEEIDRRITVYLPYEQAGRATRPLADVRAWLRGRGELTLSVTPDRFLRARITDQIDLEPVVEGFTDLKGDVIFRCEPFLYHLNPRPVTVAQAGGGVNPGTAFARPVITVDATGDIDLVIDGQTVLLTGLDGPIVVDSTLEEAYAIDQDTGEYVNLNNRMAGDFPLIRPGAYTMGWAAGEGAAVNSIVMAPNWRDEC